MRPYFFNGLAGCVVQQKSQRTGFVVGLYNAAQAGFDDGDGLSPWATVCEAHGHIVNHDTLAVARSHLGDPAGWCELCHDPENRP